MARSSNRLDRGSSPDDESLSEGSLSGEGAYHSPSESVDEEGAMVTRGGLRDSSIHAEPVEYHYQQQQPVQQQRVMHKPRSRPVAGLGPYRGQVVPAQVRYHKTYRWCTCLTTRHLSIATINDHDNL